MKHRIYCFKQLFTNKLYLGITKPIIKGYTVKFPYTELSRSLEAESCHIHGQSLMKLMTADFEGNFTLFRI